MIEVVQATEDALDFRRSRTELLFHHAQRLAEHFTCFVETIHGDQDDSEGQVRLDEIVEELKSKEKNDE